MLGLLGITKTKKENKGDFFESNLNSLCICSYELEKREVGAYLLKNRIGYRLNFAFETSGLHSESDAYQIQQSLSYWDRGLTSVPEGETLRIYPKAFSLDALALDNLENKAKNSDNSVLKLLAYGQQKSIERRIKTGWRSLYKIIIFCSYTYQPNKKFDRDFIESNISALSEVFSALNGEMRHKKVEFLRQMLKQAFYQGYLPWEQILSQRAKISIKALTAEALWQYIWYEFNSLKAKPIPHLITITKSKNEIVLDEIIQSERDFNSTLVAGEKGMPSIPKRPDRWNSWIKIRGNYVAALVLEERLEGYDDERHHFDFFWRPFTLMHNLEIAWEIEPVNQRFEKYLMQRGVKVSRRSIKETDKRGGINVDADEEIKEYVEAQQKIIAGKKFCLLSVVFFVYRSSLTELNSACEKLVKFFPNGKLIREVDAVDELWLNKQPIVWNYLVNAERRVKYASDDVSFPIVCPQLVDSRNTGGLELITKDGGKPVYIDFRRSHRGMLTIAESGMGKSTLAAETIVHNLYDNIPSVVLDYGNIDGTTTYTDLADSLGDDGANIEAAHTKHNIIQTPNLTKLSPQLKDKNFVTFQGFVLNCLETIILGSDRTSKTAKRVKALLKYVVPEFYSDSEIASRYLEGHKKGIGSNEWQKMPTLKDLLAFIEKIDPDSWGTDIVEEALNEIVWGLTTFIKSPLGQKLTCPSEVNINAKLVCFSIRGARDKDEAVILSLCSQSIAIGHALQFPKCYVLIDEGNILFQNEALAISNAEFVVNGRKGGIFCNVLLQSISTLAKCSVGELFLDNLRIRLIGAIQNSAIPNLSQFLEETPDSFYNNIHHSFLPDGIRLCSNWLLLANGLKFYVSHYPSPILLGLVATGTEERKARIRYLQTIPNRLRAISLFGHDYEVARRNSIPFSSLNPSKYL